MKTVLRIWLATLALTFCRGAAILTNGGFESGLGGWRPLWTRDAKVGTLILDSATAHRGKNSALEVSLSTSNATLSVLDRRTGQRFEQNPLSRDVILTGATTQRDQLQLKLFHVASGQEIAGTIRLEHDLPEFTFELVAQGELPNTLRFPYPFASRPGEYLVVPMNEGISYPVEDQSIEPFSLIAYGGHGICMAFWGSTDGARGHLAIIETPDDASIRIERHDGLLAIAPQWEAQRGQFGYD